MLTKTNQFSFKKRSFQAALVLFILFFYSCKPLYNSTYKKPLLVDEKASREVKKLHKKLSYSSKQGFAIGHQDATAYGVGWEYDKNNITSDVHQTSGDFPAVYGFDISKIELKQEKNIDGIPFRIMRELIIDAYKKGGLITISWHADNPTTNGDSWDKTPTVKNIIPNGAHEKKYDLWLASVANFIKTLTYKGKKIPILFRPFHEMNGDWFWWGNPNCSSADYIQLWQKTVTTLKDKHKLHNLMYVYSPNKQNPNETYLNYYPGDAYVDVLGIDIYDHKNSDSYITSVTENLKLVKDIAIKKNKLFAFTETGLETITTKNWFTKILYPAIKNSGISWILLWRNQGKTHHYMPYKGHINEADFKVFKSFSETLFLNDLKALKY